MFSFHFLSCQKNFVRLEALDPNAYEAFQASRNLRDVVDRVNAKNDANGVPGMSKKLSVRANLMTPVLPMLVSTSVKVMLADGFSTLCKVFMRIVKNFTF